MLVLAAGQEAVVRRMVAPALPESWRFVDARIEGSDIHVRYERGGARAELQLVAGSGDGIATTLFRIRVRASAGRELVRALVAAVVASTRELEGALRWANSEQTAIVPVESTALSAAVARFRELERLGWFHEALEYSEAALSELGRPAELLIGNAHLRASLHDDEAAAVRAREALAAPSPIAEHAALILAKLGHRVAAPGSSEIHAAIHFALGDYARAAEIHARLRSPASRLAVGMYHAWLGDDATAAAQATSVLGEDQGNASAHGLLGLAHALAGRYRDALDHLELADDDVAAICRAESWMHLGELDRARDEILRAGDRTHDRTTHAPAMIVRAAILDRLGQSEPVDSGLREAMTQIVPEAPTDYTRALERMTGNRTWTATFVRDSALVPVTIAPSARLASKYALWRFVATASTDETERDFDRVHAAHPGVAEPYNYRGELWLYVGDPVRARLCFERALALYPRSRWAFIGLAAVAVLEERPSDALATLAHGIDVAGGPGPTAYAYRGEAFRLLGRFAEARADLEHAVRTHPTRVGAWVNLGLLRAETGDREGLGLTMEWLRTHAPGLYADAAASNDHERLTEMRTLLRGNRASTCVTYFTREGRLRTVVPPR